MQKWLLVTNCQQFGLANCLRLYGQIEMDAYAIVTFRKKVKEINISSYDRVVVSPQIFNTSTFDFSKNPNVIILPFIYFDAYHPDLCYLHINDGESLKGPIGDYHSIIAICSFHLGLDANRALGFYSESHYRDLGWFNLWESSKKRLLDTFSQFDWDISKLFLEWGREDEFMYTCNHPKIRCLRDLAICVLKKAGITPLESNVLPHDNLLNGAIYPVYPEIGTRLGISGNYFYKPPNCYQFITLNDFVKESFNVYSSHPNTVPHPAYKNKYDNTIKYLEKNA